MHYQRNPAVRETEVEGEYFLVEPESGEIYYLDVMTSGIWRFLEEPRSHGELLDVLRAARTTSTSSARRTPAITVSASLTDT